MAIEATLVSPGMLPPTIRRTPNAPIEWRKTRTAAAAIPPRELGMITLKNAALFDKPRI